MGFIHLNLNFAVTVDDPEYDDITTSHLAFHTSQMSMSSEINLGGATVSSGHTLRESNGEYRSEHSQEQFKMHVIDPKVNSNAYIPAHTTSSVVKTRTITEDFPSHHNKRSLLNLDPVEQRKFRSVETRPITTNAYLSESVNRHRAAEESKLKQYLKAKEGDANQPWNKPDWPGASQNQESLRELEQIRKSIETLQKPQEFDREAGPVQSYDNYCLNERYYRQRRLTEYEGYQNYRPMVPPPPPPPPPPPAAKSPNKLQYQPGMTNNLSYTPSTNLPKSSMSQTRPQTASFNGPFFKMEEVSPQDISYNLKYQQNEIDRSSRYVGNGGETVVVWPPNREEEHPRPTSSRSLRDPDRVGEYERQKQLESIAIQQKKQKEQENLAKQFKAAQLQQQRLESRGYDTGRLSAEYKQEYKQATPSPALQSEPGPSPMLRVYETRPISAQSADSANNQPSWRRTYIVEEQEIAARNEIIKSEEVLEREKFDIDLLQRRDTFVEKPETPIQIQRTGRRWEPPPEEPYVWPTASRNDAEFKWVPVVGDPGYKHETNAFIPTPSPPHSPIKGRGTGPLDDVAQRQTRHLVTPQPDGSHRPKSVFKSPRSTPSGGFVPHAPNAVRVARDSPQPTNERRVIQESRYRVINDSRREGEVVNDWEKIYELPPHASTLTEKQPPRRIDVSKRTEMFEKRVRRSHSAHQSRHHSTPLTVITDPHGRKSSHQPIPTIRHSTRSDSYRDEIPSRPSSARSQRAAEIFNEATRPSPPPPSYNRAKRYVVPALPPGRKEKSRSSPPRPPPGNTRRLLGVVQTAASSHQHNRPLSASLQVSPDVHSISPASSKYL
uniref:ZM domain-containing protein n=1 Tax=Bursaphelenchus xylophilus TaxID=6326 RepID=A0A1I7SQR0_BURXY